MSTTNSKINEIYMDEQYLDMDDMYNDEYGLYTNICQQCGYQQPGYDDTSTSPHTFYCTICWEEFNNINDKESTIKNRTIDEKQKIKHIDPYNNRSKKKKEHKQIYLKPFHKTKRKKIVSSDLDRDRIQIIVQQYYRIHHNNWHNKLKCLIESDKLEQLKTKYQDNNDSYLVYIHDPMICKFNWHCHTLLISGFCNDNKLFVPDVVTIMVWKYYTGFTGFDIKQQNNQDAEIRIERKLENIDYGYKAKWYEQEMIIALVSISNKKQRRKTDNKWPTKIKMRHILPLYKMVYH